MGPPPIAGAELRRRVEKVVGYAPLCEMDDSQRRELHEALLEADSFEYLPGKWEVAILKTEQSQPKLRSRHSSLNRKPAPTTPG